MRKRLLLKGLHFYAATSGAAALVVLQVSGISEFSFLELLWIVGSAAGLIVWNAWRLTEL